MISNWLDGYYEALEFFYWEPQHLGRKKNIAGEFNTLEKVLKHLRKIEVTLNHNINQFLLLAPKSLHRDIFNAFFGENLSLPFEMHGRGIDTNFELVGAMQPDFLFISSREVVSIEMKIAAKSSIDQVLKYALLGLAVEAKEGCQKRHYLGFLGVGIFENQWKEKFRTIDELRDQVGRVDLQAFLMRQPMKFRALEKRFRSIVEGMTFGFANYQSFAGVLRAQMPKVIDESPATEAYTNLLQGMLMELRIRDLAQ
jgi:hypothetical protein